MQKQIQSKKNKKNPFLQGGRGKGPGESLIRPLPFKLWPFEEGGPWLSALLSTTYDNLRKCLEINATFSVYKGLKM
jgi:hypothetical protein